ncbi:MAG: MATE family efflux transporter [Anaerolineales bacterium]
MSLVCFKPIQRLVGYYRDPAYFRELFRIGMPIAFQQFVFSLLNMVGNVLVGQRGDVAMAAVSVAGQIYFLLSLFLFGVASGSAMVTAQLWGKRDVPTIRKVLALCLWLSLGISGLFLLVSEFFPVQILSIYSSDPAVLALGSAYLRIMAGSFLFFAVTFSYALVLRSMGNVKLPVGVSVASLALNILLTYGFIFGKLGLPELGVLGAAWAMLIARLLECVVLLLFTYLGRSPAAASWSELCSFDGKFFLRVMKPVWPVILNELLWSLGISAYNAVYGHIGTGALAAINVLSSVDNIAMVLFMGISNGTSVAVGNRIGAGDVESAYRYVGRSIGLGTALALVVGAAVWLLRAPVVSLYKISPQAAASAYQLLTILGGLLWLRMTNMTLIIGMLRAGGDTRFSLFLDGVIIWVLGVPMALLGAFVLHLPVQWVYLMVMSEEAAKYVLGLRRYVSRRWIHDLTHLSVAAD